MKHLLILGFSLLFTLGLVFYNFSSVSTSDCLTNTLKKENTETYPFEIYDEENYFSITQMPTKEVYEKYTALFEKNNYSRNGYCWEDHIIQILEKENEELISSIHFDSEADTFFAYSNDKETREKLLKILCPIFQDLDLLEKYIQEADRSRIDD